MAVAVVVVLALLAAGVGVAVWLDGGDEATAVGERPRPTPTEPPTSASPSTTEPPPTTDDVDEALGAVVDELEQFVEEERGLQFLREVEVELADDTEFEARLLEDFEESRQDLDDTGEVLQALGLVEPDEDVAEAYRSLLGAGVIGFYDPETDELVVRGTEPTPYVQQTIVHELVHALEDQHFELDRPQLDDADDESSSGFSSLVEGSAVVIQDAWTSTLSASEAAELAEEEFRAGSAIDPFAFPPILVELLVAPYELGPDLVDAIADDGGQAALDQAFADPPTTTKEVLDPAAYLGGFAPVVVAPPPADGQVFDEGAFGQLVLQYLLAEELTPSEAELVADGWVGDWYVAWADGAGGACVRVDVATEDQEAGARLIEGLEAWASTAPDATVEQVAPDRVRFTSCG